MTLAASSAHAGNDEGALLSSQAIMQAGAVTADASGGTALWYNPAGLGAGSHDSVDVSVNAYTLRITDQSTLLRGDGVETQQLDTLDVRVLPSSVSGMRQLGGGVAFGFGLFAPEGRTLRQRGTARGNVGGLEVAASASQLYVLTSYFAGAGVGFRVAPGLRLGVSLFGIYELVEAFQSITLNLSAGPDEIGVHESIAADGEVFGITGGLGAQYEGDGWLVGVAARGPGLKLSSNVRALTQSSRYDGTPAGTTQDVELTDESEVSEGEPMRPGLVRGGGALRIGDAQLSAGLSWQGELEQDELGFRRRAILNGRIGARGPLSRSLHLGGGVFTDNASRPVDDTGSQVDFIGGVVALEFRSAYIASPLDEPEQQRDEDAPPLVFSTTLGLRYAYGSGRANSNLLRDDGAGFPEIVTSRSDVTVHEVGIELGSSVLF